MGSPKGRSPQSNIMPTIQATPSRRSLFGKQSSYKIDQRISILFLFVSLILFALSFFPQFKNTLHLRVRTSARTHAAYDKLIIYIHAGGDPEYLRNFQYFIDHAVKANDGCQYRFVVQEDQQTGAFDESLLPKLPPNAQIWHHENKCFDIGTVGWALDRELTSNSTSKNQYKHFMWLNSSVRGPFLPSWLPESTHWTTPFLAQITPTTKLVGCTINCGMMTHPRLGVFSTPHVQSYVAATDAKGLAVLQQSKHVFSCHDTYFDTVLFGEMMMSMEILKAGYNIASLMDRYKGVDFRDAGVSQCNEQLSPLADYSNDGISIHPFEVLFVKVKSAYLQADGQAVGKAGARISEWRDQRLQSQNPEAWHKSLSSNRQGRYIDELRADLTGSGENCFDWEFFATANKWDWPAISALGENKWEWFLNSGVKESRPYRRSCVGRMAGTQQGAEG